MHSFDVVTARKSGGGIVTATLIAVDKDDPSHFHTLLEGLRDNNVMQEAMTALLYAVEGKMYQALK
jgi:hypothetical protein